MQIEEIDVVCGDGYVLKGRLFYVNHPEGQNIIIINPALAVPQSYYARFATYAANHGYAIITYDYRGIGESYDAEIDGSSILLEHWGRFDFNAILQKSLTELDPKQIYVIGHSAGGQLIGLAEHSSAIDGIILVTSPSGYWRYYKSPFRYFLAFFWHIMLPALNRGKSYFPAHKIGLGSGDVPSGVIRQWAEWCRSKDYLFAEEHGLELSRYSSLSIPICAYTFTDDSFAPPSAVDALLSQYPAAKIEHRILQPSDLRMKSVGHFGFFRDHMQNVLWDQVFEWFAVTED